MHIPEYSQIVSPLYLVTRKKNTFHWGPEEQKAFAQIKQEIAHAVALGPVRTGPDVKNMLYSAARNHGLSWSLWQKVPGETRGRPLGFWSRSYRGSEANYPPTEKEILAAYEGVQAASKVIHDRETCAAIKQAKRVKPLWYGGRGSKNKYGEAWQIDSITLPQTRQGKRYLLTMVEASTGGLPFPPSGTLLPGSLARRPSPLPASLSSPRLPLPLPGRAMPPARPRPRAGLPRARPRPSRRGLASARLWPYWRWRCWAGISAVCGGGIAALCLRLARARPRPRGRLQPRARPRPRPLPGPAEDTGGAAAAAASAAASPARAPPLGSAAAGPEPPVPRCEERTPGHGRPGAAEGRSGAVAGPGPSADSRVPPAGTAPEALQERYRLGSLLGRGGFGSVFAATRLSDGAPVAIKRVPRNRVRHWGELPDGSRAPLEIVLLAKVSTGFPGVVQLLEWLELPNHIVMVMERPERCQDLQRFIEARQFLPEEVARELFRQVLEAVWHCTSCGVLHRDIKPGNIVLDLATGQAKLIDFGCGTYLQETAYTHFAGTPSYSPPEWNDFGWYHGEAATIWSLGILLHQMVCGEHPFRRGRNLSWGQLPLPQGLSQECKDLIRWCLSVNSLERPTLEDLFCDPWVQDIPRP
ncbi:serine/threonine-protein kinase pim-2-like [Agelaius tricolor]|uniref:serine/threonine-protein kinase pim-2-like n=1 Tax=Agelaius tricolor TaxID=9191 RepID=UPI0039F1ECBF